MRVGNDLLAAILYEGAALKSLRKGDVAGIFLNTFYKVKNGKKVFANGTVKKIINTNKLSEFVIHLAPFDKSHAYPISKLKKQVLEDAKWCQEMQKSCPGTKLILSPFCEHNHKAGDMKPLFTEMKALAPDCDFINSIWKGEEVPGIDTEIHIPNSKDLPKIPKNNFTISLDGFGGDGSGDSPDANLNKILVPYIMSGICRHVRGWNFRHNGKYGAEDEASVGNRKHMPSLQYLMGTLYTVEAAINPGAGNWPVKKLQKTFADDHGNDLSKTKDCRFMVILPDVNMHSVDVFDIKNRKIATLHDLGLPPHTEVPKGKRFYGPYMSEIADEAFRIARSYKVRVGNNPQTDCRLRQGYMR